MSDNIGGVFLTLLTWMMGILLGLNALWFGWQVNQVNDYNTQVGQMISKEGGYDRVSGWNAAELSAQSYHNHFALYSWVPDNKDADNRPVKDFRKSESVTQAHGDRIRYRIKAQIPLIAFVPKFKWTQTFDETVVSNAGNHSANHAGLAVNSTHIVFLTGYEKDKQCLDDQIGTLDSYKAKDGQNWGIAYATAAYDKGFVLKPIWRNDSLSATEQEQVAELVARLLNGDHFNLTTKPGTRVMPYLPLSQLLVPDNYLNGYSAGHDDDLDHVLLGITTRKVESLMDWTRDAYGSIPDYALNDEVSSVQQYTSDGRKMDIAVRSQVAFLNPPTSALSQWRWDKWSDEWPGYHDALNERPHAPRIVRKTNYYVYKDRLGQLTGNNNTQHAGEVTQAN